VPSRAWASAGRGERPGRRVAAGRAVVLAGGADSRERRRVLDANEDTAFIDLTGFCEERPTRAASAAVEAGAAKPETEDDAGARVHVIAHPAASRWRCFCAGCMRTIPSSGA